MRRRQLALVPFLALMPLLLAACAMQNTSTGSRVETALFSGVVTDNARELVAGAEVRINGVVTTTNKNGAFRMALPTSDLYILGIIHKDYAYYATTTHRPIERGQYRLTGASQFVVDPKNPISLTDRRSEHDCISRVRVRGSESPCGEGLSIDIPANALVHMDGSSPSDNVIIKLATFEIHTEGMPGPGAVMAATDESRTAGFMIPYGAGQVDAYDSQTGDPLQLRTGQNAKITIPIHRVRAARDGTPPNEIPLLRFDRVAGRWVSIGVMHLEASKYIGYVTHFTEYNADLVEQPWGCMLINFAGIPPDDIFDHPLSPLEVYIEVASSPFQVGQPGNYYHPVYHPISFLTDEVGTDATWKHVVYTLPVGVYYRVSMWHPVTGNLLNDEYFSTSIVFLNAQAPQDPSLPADPWATCTHVTLWWLDSEKKTNIDLNADDIELLAGSITYPFAIEIVDKGDPESSPEIIGVLPAGERVAVLGQFKENPYFIIITRSGGIGYAPRRGADMSRVIRGISLPKGETGL